MSVYFKRPSVIQGRDTWTTGSGSIGIYSQNGGTSCNERVNDTDPFGSTSVVWEARSPGDNSADGGWDTTAISIDPSKLYRFSVWVRRTSSTSTGRFYFGCGYGSENNLLQLDGTANTNPYWECPLMDAFTQNTWYLIVGHIFPYNYNSLMPHSNTGAWTIAGGKIGYFNYCNISYGDMKFQSSTTNTTHRTYLYYSTNSSDRLQFYNPLVEICDGSEGTVESLLNNSLNNILATTTPTRIGSSFKHNKVVATGGNQIMDVGQWRVHVFSGTSSFVVSSYVGSGLEVEYMIVGGGGGTGYDVGGGGGGGGMLTGSTILSGATYTITVGGGGASGQTSGTRGTTGSNTTFNGLTAYGGGGGGAYNTNINGIDGGCGGGGGMASGTAGTGGNGTSGYGQLQGYAGGAGTATNYGSGGGGGTGSIGAAAIANSQVAGGIGRVCGIWARPYKFGGGGIGNSDSGIISPTGVGLSGVWGGYYGYGANGTGYPNNSPYSGNGGVVIIRYKYK